MIQRSLTTALDNYVKARSAFDKGDFDRARRHISHLESLNYSFVRQMPGERFEWRSNAVCIVAYKQMPETEQLLLEISELASDPSYCFIFVSNSQEDLFPYAGDITDARFLKLLTGGNFGASIGRNIAIHYAHSDTLTFIDDDGITTADSLRKLVETRRLYDAVAVRGRVIPNSNLQTVPKHYDLGSGVKQRFADIEGMTTWKTSALKAQRFDPLLYGHEGVELTGRLYPIYGPDSFLYEPSAVLRHDFVKSDSRLEDKTDRMKRNDDLISQKNVDLPFIKSVFYNLDSAPYASKLLSFRRALVSSCTTPKSSGKVTFVTTCYNGSLHIPEYCASIKRQTNSDFEVVFVDDGSTDNSAELVAKEFQHDRRFKLISIEHVGRAGALNIALANINTDYAIIADVDDISVPQRVEWTLKAHEIWPRSDLIGFGVFDKKDAVRSARPLILGPTSIRVRRYFGMPCPFPGLSFRTSSFTLPFNTELMAGVDCDWLDRNIEADSLGGWCLPLGATFYGTHDGQITASKRGIQRQVSLNCVRKLHRQILELHTADDEEALELFTGWKPLTTMAEWHRLKNYADRLIHGLCQSDIAESEEIQHEVVRHVNERCLHIAKRDQGKLKKAEEKLRMLEPLEGQVKRAASKLEWNRARVAELEKILETRRPFWPFRGRRT